MMFKARTLDASSRTRVAVQRQTRRANRKRAFMQRVKISLSWVLSLSLVVVITGGALNIWYKDWVDAQIVHLEKSFYEVTSEMGFTIEETQFYGHKHSSEAEILHVLGLVKGSSIFGFNLSELKQKLEQLPWIEEAVIERRLPQTIRVHLYERKPHALWQYQNTLYVIDSQGEVLSKEIAYQFPDLMLFVGENAQYHADELLTFLETYPDFKQLIKAALWIGDRRWDLQLQNGVLIKFPEIGFQQAFERFLKLDAEFKLLSTEICVIDLRLPDQISFQRKTSPANPSR